MRVFPSKAHLFLCALLPLLAFGAAVAQTPAPAPPAANTDPTAVQTPAPMPASSSVSRENTSAPLSSSEAQSAGPQTAGTPAVASSVRIGSGDLVEVSVFGATDLSGRFRVSDAGDIDLPVTGRVHLEGLDAESAAREIEQRLKSSDIVKSPIVEVFVLEYTSQGVTLVGDVKAPGVYPILGSRRLMDVLASAGGLAVTAGRDIRIQHRDDFEHPEVIPIDNVTVTPARNPVIQSGDTITVPRSGVVYVVGDVGRPGGFLVENNNRLDLLKLMALAGGPNRTAGLNNSRLIRTTPTGRVEIDIGLKKVMEGKSQSLMLQDGDILYVPASEKKYLAFRGIEAAIQTATGLLLYRY
ncbi:MAG TPA: polysaccharide biosynthesis/export family protein [Acidisarcina sp.]